MQRFFGRHHHHHHDSKTPSSTSSKTLRIFTRADDNFSLTVRDDQVVLAPNDPYDPHQHWFKDMRYSTEIKDEEGFPGFVLVNLATGQAIQHAFGAREPVRLVKYNPECRDDSVIWSESNETGKGFRCIRMVNNIRLNFDAFEAVEDCGGVKDGTIVVLWEWNKGENQQWKIETQTVSLDSGSKQNPYGRDSSSELSPRGRNVMDSGSGQGRNLMIWRIYCKADPDYSLTVRDGSVVLAPRDDSNEYQGWYIDSTYSNEFKDEEGHQSFALVNRGGGVAIQHSAGQSYPVGLVDYNWDANSDKSLLWTQSKDVGEGYKCIRMFNNIHLNFDAFHGDHGVKDGTIIVLWEWNKGDNQKWKFEGLS